MSKATTARPPTASTPAWRSPSQPDPENLARQRIDARHLVGARAAFDGGSWEVAAWARNLFDERYIENRIFDFFQTAVVERGEPRTYGLTASFDF